jgi:hypothetical protein
MVGVRLCPSKMVRPFTTTLIQIVLNREPERASSTAAAVYFGTTTSRTWTTSNR